MTGKKHWQRQKVRFHLCDSYCFYCLMYLGALGLESPPWCLSCRQDSRVQKEPCLEFRDP